MRLVTVSSPRKMRLDWMRLDPPMGFATLFHSSPAHAWQLRPEDLTASVILCIGHQCTQRVGHEDSARADRDLAITTDGD